MTPFTQIVMIQFLLYNGPSNLFTSVTILVEQTSTGALIPSASVQSTRLYHFPAALDYGVMTCEVSILLQFRPINIKFNVEGKCDIIIECEYTICIIWNHNNITQFYLYIYNVYCEYI